MESITKIRWEIPRLWTCDTGQSFSIIKAGNRIYAGGENIVSAIDIPARLKEHTELLGVMPGWDYLTGERETIKQVLKALEVYTADIANHPPAVFVVDGRRDRWYRLNGFPSPKLIEQTMHQQLVIR